MKGRLLLLGALLALVVASCAAESGPATTAAQPPTPGTIDAVDVTAGSLDLEGLVFEEFLEKSFSLLAVRDPQGLTSTGVAEAHGLRNDQLNDLSDGFIRETQAIQVVILQELRRFDRAALASPERISYDSYEWFLDQQVRGHRFMYHDWPAHHFVNSYNFNLLLFLTDEHTVDSPEDAADYVARLGQIRRQVGQLIDGLQRRVDRGVLPVAEIAVLTIGRLERDIGGAVSAEQVDVTRLDLYTSFEGRLDGLPGLTSSAKTGLLQEAQSALETSFVPGWIALADFMKSIRHLASSEAGVGRHPDGAAYYEHLLRGHSSTDLTPQQVHELGLLHVDRVQTEMRAVFDQLGRSADESLIDLRSQASQEAGFVSGPNSVSLNEQLIVEAETVFRPWFELWPESAVEVVPDPEGGGYYVPGAVDGSRPGAFYAGSGGSSLMSVPTINYHEAVPGHHTQIAIAQSLDLPSFQRFVIHNGFAEGWALYAERLASEAGLYAEDPHGNIGRLELELLRAVRLVVDTGIHSMGWSSDEARAYMNSVIPTWSHEVQRYMVLPGQATGYMVGMQEILRLRELVREKEGDDFDIANFHTLVLGSGNQPLVILDRIVRDYLGE